MSATTLPGTIPGLLRRGAPVLAAVGPRPPALPAGMIAADAIVAGLVQTRPGVVVDVAGSPSHAVVALEATRKEDASLDWLPRVALALDLTDPAGCDAAARYLAERVGLAVGSTAPRWTRDEDGAWTLSTGRASLVFCPMFCGSGMLPPTWDGVRYVAAPAGMATLTDPAALAAAVLAVAGGSRGE